MSYYDWINSYGTFRLWNIGQIQQEAPVLPSDFTLPSRPAPTWSDPVTGFAMNWVASSPYYDVKIENAKYGYNWQGTRMDVYRTAIPANSIYYGGPYTNPILPSYDLTSGQVPYILPTSYETYTSKMVYDKTLGKYVQVDQKTGVQEMSYEDRIRLGAPDTLTSSDIARSLRRRDYYTGALIGGSK
ncbi:MAG TPA: hypothetical protein PLJ03_10615 [Syntrophales bacterium]|nr:hypothetical protein [Syntrophales bacterium]